MSLSTFKQYKNRTICAALIVASASVTLGLGYWFGSVVYRALH